MDLLDTGGPDDEAAQEVQDLKSPGVVSNPGRAFILRTS